MDAKTGKTRVSRNFYSIRPIISYVPRNIIAFISSFFPFGSSRNHIGQRPIAISAAGSARIICLGSCVAEDENRAVSRTGRTPPTKWSRENGRKRERKKVRAGLTGRSSSCNSRSRIVLGPRLVVVGDSEPGGVISRAREKERKREIIITRIRRLVRARRPSAEFGHVARVPRPHHHVSRYPFRARKFLRSSVAAA